MPSRSLARGVGLVAMVPAVLAAGTSLLGQTVGPQNPPLILQSVAGKDSFEFYCAQCHGRDGAGEGPMSARLRAKPPDLRLLAQRNGGDFPRDRVLDFVTNGRAEAYEHGTADMPPWGRAFAGLERSDARVKVRIANIVDYIESMQVK